MNVVYYIQAKEMRDTREETKMTKVLDRLTKFYTEEANGLPHEKSFLWDLAWDLAETLEVWGSDGNAWKLSNEEFETTIQQLRQAPSTTLIDTVVNVMHQSLLHNEQEDDSVMFDYCNGNLVEYLLNRDNDEFWSQVS